MSEKSWPLSTESRHHYEFQTSLRRCCQGWAEGRHTEEHVVLRCDRSWAVNPPRAPLHRRRPSYVSNLRHRSRHLHPVGPGPGVPALRMTTSRIPAWLSRHGSARLASAGPGRAWLGKALNNSFSQAGRGSARPGSARLGSVWRGGPRHAWARRGAAWHGLQGLTAGPGVAGRGSARQGLVRQGKATTATTKGIGK
jgi:hypothetical protein